MINSRLKLFYKRLQKNFNGPIVISTIYFTFGFCWIFFSDRILNRLSQSHDFYVKFQTYKGWIYVLITTGLIYTLLKIYSNYKEKSILLLKEHKKIISENLEEKEALIKEIYHRVKNNLQIMISFLRLKKTYHKEKHLERALDEIINMIFSIALIHERLYKTESFSEVNFNSYIKDIVQHLVSSHEMAKTIKINFDLENIVIPIDKAIPCGIMINEIITNSLKYAFPDGKTGKIDITFKTTSLGKYKLIIRDDGIGFSIKKEKIKENSLGLTLIEILSNQLEADIKTVSDKKGTQYTIIF